MPIPFRPSILALACAHAVLLSGCGGGSTSHNDAAQYLEGNDNPRAGSSALGVDTGPDGAYSSIDGFNVRAGDNQQADQGVSVVFNGQVSLPTGDSLASLQWTQIDGPVATMQGASTSTLVIEAPHVESVETLTFRLTATDMNGNKASDTVSVVVSALKPFARVTGTTVNESAGVASLEVTLSEIPHSAVNLNYEIQAVTAQLNSDYSAATGQISFAAGQQKATISIPLLNDDAIEPTETFLVKLLANDSVGVAIDSAFVSILDDDSSAPVAARALLGPIAGAEVSVTDFFTKQIYCRTTTNSSNDLAQAGKFTLPASCIKSGAPKLITVSGGRDLDANDDGQLDSEPVNISLDFHAVVVPEITDFTKQLNVSAITEAAYLRAGLAELGSADAIKENYNQSANALLKQDLNSDKKIDAADLLYWNPSNDRQKFKKSLSLLDSTKNAILYGVESNSDLTALAEHLLVDPMGLLYADDAAEFGSAYRTFVSALDNNRVFYATVHYFQSGPNTAVHNVNLTDPTAITQTNLFAQPLPRAFDAVEAMAGNIVLRTGVGNVYGESLDIFPVTATGNSSTAEFDGMSRGTMSPIDYAQNGLVIGVPFNYEGDTSGRFLRIGQVASGGFNANTSHPGSNLSFRRNADCPATSGGAALIRANNTLYKVKVLNANTVAAFYHSECFYNNESASGYQNRVGIYSIAANNIFNLQSQIVLDTDAAAGISGHFYYEVKDALLSGSQLYTIAYNTGLRQINTANGAVKTINPSIFSSEPFQLQTPMELSRVGSNIFELVRDINYASQNYTSRAIVVKFDASNVEAVSEVGRLSIEGAGSCALLTDALTNISGRSMSVSGGNLLLSFAQQGFLDGQYNYLGMLLFDANDIFGTKTYFSERNFSNLCEG